MPRFWSLLIRALVGLAVAITMTLADRLPERPSPADLEASGSFESGEAAPGDEAAPPARSRRHAWTSESRERGLPERLCASLDAYLRVAPDLFEPLRLDFNDVMELAGADDQARTEELWALNRELMEVLRPFVTHLREADGNLGHTPVSLLEVGVEMTDEFDRVLRDLLDGREVSPGRVSTALLPLGNLRSGYPKLVDWTMRNCPELSPPS